MRFQGTGNERDADINATPEQLRQRIAKRIAQGRRRRSGQLSEAELDLS